MNQQELHRLCGLPKVLSAPTKHWAPAQLKFIGAEGYVLGTKSIEVRLQHHSKGVSLTTKGRLSVNASQLLGKQIKHARLYDVEVVTESITLSLAHLCPKMYPLVLRMDEVVELN